ARQLGACSISGPIRTLPGAPDRRLRARRDRDRVEPRRSLTQPTSRVVSTRRQACHRRPREDRMLHVRSATDRTRLGGARAALCAFVCCLFALGLVGPARAATNNIFTVAGTLTMSGSTGDGGPATAAKLNEPNGVAATADGGYLIADTSNHAIRQVSPTGTITTVAGTLTVSGSTGDGGPATAAKLFTPDGVAATADGGYLIADTSNQAIRRVSPAGTITTVAGTLTVPGSTGDGGPATAAKLQGPDGVVATPDGGFLIADTSNSAIRRVSPAGRITTVAGTLSTSGSTGDGGPATAAKLPNPSGV